MPLEARRTRPGAAFALAALLVIVAAAAGYDWLASQWLTRPLAPLATPPGITLQQRTDPKRASPAAPLQVVYADEHGMTLYVRGGTNAATAECGGACGKDWRPALAPFGATADGDWTLRAGPDGSQQWVYRGAPLYRFDRDTAIGDALGDGADSGAWHAAVFDFAPGVPTPGDISVREIADAGGVGLVDADGMTLYRYVGRGSYAESDCESGVGCLRHWRPLGAPAIANRVGDFSVITRSDGISQWAYLDRPLYLFDGDQKSGDANGIGVDSRFDAALIVRQFMPAGVTIRGGTELGRILETTAGAPLYQRDRLDPNESHDPRGDRGPPALGRAYGTATCEAACVRQRLPLIAPAGARPSGYWDVMTRPEGTRQWAYKGFALYSYAGDVPGELRGNEVYELAQVGDDGAAALAATGKRTADAQVAGVDPRLPSGASVAGVGLSALFWHVVVP